MLKKGAKVWCFIVILVFLFAIPSLCFVVMAGGVGVDGCLFGDQNIGKLEDLHSNSYQPKGANSKIITSLSTFEKGDKILNSKGDKGMILRGPEESYGINWWFIRWEKESSEGWSKENQLRKNDFNPSIKFSIGDPVEVCDSQGLDVRTDPPDLAWNDSVGEGTKGIIKDGPFYGIPKDQVSEEKKILYHFWEVDFGGITGWCAEGWPYLGGVDYLKKDKSPVIKSTKFKTGDFVRVIADAGRNIRTEPKLGEGYIIDPPSPLQKGSEGQIMGHQDNGVFNDGHYWWYVKFGDYEGWCAEHGLEKSETAEGPFPSPPTPLTKTVKAVHEAIFVPATAEMTISYNWFGQDENGEDVYVISEIDCQSLWFVGYYEVSIESPSGTIWNHKTVTIPPPFNPHGSPLDFGTLYSASRETSKGIIVYPRDWISVKAYGVTEVEMLSIISIVGGIVVRLPPMPASPPFFSESAATYIAPDYIDTSDFPPIVIEEIEILPATLGHLCSPGELRIYDSQGRVTGLLNGEIKQEIPDSAYFNGSFVILFPSDSYRYEVVGTETGTYDLGVISIGIEKVNAFGATGIPTSPNAIHQYTINWAALSQGEKGVTVKIDSDGDDVVEHTVITNNSFHPLIAEFTFSPENPIIGEKVTLDASTSFDLGGGVIKKYCWEFYNAANQDPFYVIEGHDKKIISYSFNSEGIYRVRLTVTDDDGEYSYTESSTKVGSAKSDEDVRLGVPFFSQRATEWKDQKLGKSTGNVGAHGCALTSAAMVSKYFGWDIDPLRLDAALTEIGGISSNAELSWPKVEEASGGYVLWKGKKTHQKWSNIDYYLSMADPYPCIINVYCKGVPLHYVVIRGKDGSGYHFWDPADLPGEDRIWPNGALGRTYTWGNEKTDPRIYLYHKGARPSEKNQISVKDKPPPPYFYKWSNLGDLKSWKKKKCKGHTYNSTYVGGMYYGRNKPNNDPNKPDCWMEFTPYLQSAGKYDIYVGICADSTRSTEVKYTIYPNGIDGSSETVSKSQYSDEECWNEIKLGVFDLTGEGKTHVRITDATGVAFDGKTLCVGTIRFTKATDTLNILTPTQTAYRNVGAHDKPIKTSIEVEIKTSTDAFAPGLTNKDDYTVKIGDKTADVLIVIQKSDRYVLEIMPPKQAGDGKYDLHVELGSLSDVESNAINYGTKGLDVSLIIDSSGSMSDNDPEGYRKTAAKYFVDLANTGDKICVAEFGYSSCNSRLLLPLLEITDESSRDTVKTAIDQVVSSGATPIGGGLEKGYDELSSPRAVAGHNKVGILLTDGEDTCDTEGVARTYAQKFADNGWVLYTIGLTGDADEEDLLRELAALGNVDYKALTNEQLHEIYIAIFGWVAGEETMGAARETAQQGSTSVENALIDSSVTKARFAISWAGSDLNLILKKPDGGIIDPDVAEADPNVIYTSASSYEFYTVQSPMPGEWELRIFGADVPAGGEEYTARVMGTANLTMNMYFDRDHYSVGEPIKVSVSLTDALQPITEASVIADIELSPTASSSLKNLAGKDTLQNRLSIAQDQITLFDDGMHGDGMANDGVYANFYTNTNIEGTYKFTAKATGTRSPEEFERVIEQSIYVSVTPTPRPILPPTPTPTPRLTLTPAPTPTLTPTPRPTLRPTATLFEKIEGLTAAIRVGVGI